MILGFYLIANRPVFLMLTNVGEVDQLFQKTIWLQFV